ncbi:DUF3040 domain-containing protein [Amycolatopsis sp. NPDC059090]|uniref:DUF3040 domain-containing protein n=1 Tax=unclassified Amycolatopsis TaxID=2618356 RepID=UPI00366EC8DA
MLTDREQRALNEIERGLGETDPRLSAKLDRGSGRPRLCRRRSALEILATITSVVLIATGAFDTRPGMIVAGVVGSRCSSAGRSRCGTGKPDPGADPPGGRQISSPDQFARSVR